MKKVTKTYSETFCSANILSIEVGTNTPCGGDAGHGGLTIFKLKDKAGTGWKLECDSYAKNEPNEVTIELYGDTEAETFIQALKFAVSILEAQILLKTLERREELSNE